MSTRKFVHVREALDEYLKGRTVKEVTEKYQISCRTFRRKKREAAAKDVLLGVRTFHRACVEYHVQESTLLEDIWHINPQRCRELNMKKLEARYATKRNGKRKHLPPTASLDQEEDMFSAGPAPAKHPKVCPSSTPPQAPMKQEANQREKAAASEEVKDTKTPPPHFAEPVRSYPSLRMPLPQERDGDHMLRKLSYVALTLGEKLRTMSNEAERAAIVEKERVRLACLLQPSRRHSQHT